MAYVISFLVIFLIGFISGALAIYWLAWLLKTGKLEPPIIFDPSGWKILKKKEPIPAEQENIENLEQNKPALKTFYK